MRFIVVFAGVIVVGIATTAYGQYFDYDPDNPAEQSPIRKGEKAVIPLDTEDPTYNLWQTPRDDLAEGREPGPINVQRYHGGAGWQGIPTFFKLPIALTPEDLQAGDVDVAILGAHTDMGGGYRGAAWGPLALRASPSTVAWGEFSMDHMLTLVNPFKELNIVDYGDAPNDMLSTERTIHAVREFVRQVASVKNKKGEHVIPFIIGGDHSLMHPDVAALADVYGKGNVGVIHFDAHYDASKNFMGHLISHGQPVYRLIEEGHLPGKNFIQVGLRGYYPDADSFEWMREQGFRYHTMAEVEKRGWDAVMEDVIKEANDGPEYLFISFDIDVMDPAYTPATGTPEPNGLTPRETFPLIRRLCAESNVVGFELVELLPYRDDGYETVLNSERIVRECLVGIAMRKKGIDAKHYLSPMTIDDGRK
jgi:arginase family enzyme